MQMLSGPLLHLHLAFVLCAAAASTVRAATPGNLLVDGGFDGRTKAWAALGGGNCYAILPQGGRSGGCLEYGWGAQAATTKENRHFDQLVAVEPGRQYLAAVWVKGDGKLRPVLRIASEDWQTVATAIADRSSDWQRLETSLSSGSAARLRFQLYGGSASERRETLPGTSRFDDALLREATAEESAQARRCKVEVDPGTVIRKVNPLFFGVNTLFWIEDDAAIKDGAIARLLREMPCRLMRFPGGTAADNYHWKTGTLDNPKRFPFRGGPGTLNTDAFMRLSRQVGAEPMFVVNLETSFVRGDLDAGIREAADWVRYCNRQKGYGVKYWEIGNEQYLLTNMGARQYAEAFVRFARAMKAVDPTIKIGATGPENVAGAGAADRVPPEEVKRAMKIAEPRRTAALKELKRKYVTGPAWWPTVVRIAGAEMDMAVIHNYFAASASLGMDKPVAELRQFLDQQLPDKHVLIALTEWNVNKGSKLRGMELAMAQAEAVGRFLHGGVDLATFWPLRFPGLEWGDRSLLDLKTNTPGPFYEAMKLFSSRLNGVLIQSTTSRPEVYCCAGRSDDGRQLTLFLVNRSSQPEGVEATVSASEMDLSGAQATVLTGDAEPANRAVLRDLPVKPSGRVGTCTLPPQSLTVVTWRGSDVR